MSQTLLLVLGASILIALDAVLVVYFAGTLMSSSPGRQPSPWKLFLGLPFLLQACAVLVFVALRDRVHNAVRRKRHSIE